MGRPAGLPIFIVQENAGIAGDAIGLKSLTINSNMGPALSFFVPG
jgi:hypothetical protein